MFILLKAQNLMDIIDESVPQPQDETFDAWKEWKEKDSKAQVIVLTSTAPSQIVNQKCRGNMGKTLSSP